MAFYATKNSTALENEQILQDVLVHLQKFEYVGSGVCGISTNDVTLTPATSPVWTVDAYKSAKANNIVVVANSGKVLEGKVKSNIATAVTFDSTATKDYADGTAGAATDFTALSTYNFYILTASDDYEFGDYFGWTGDVTINMEEEFAEFKQGVPRELKNQCLLERSINVTGTNFNPANDDVASTILGMEARGLQTGQTEYQTGFNPAARAKYRITLVGNSGCGAGGKEIIYQLYKGKIRQEGAINMSEEGYKAFGWNYVVEADNLRPSGYNAMRRIRITA
jgi:hypothetical protein